MSVSTDDLMLEAVDDQRSPLIAINALDEISDMLENKTNHLAIADVGPGDAPSIISDVITASLDDGTSVTEPEPPVPQPHVTFADRVRISGSPRNSPDHRRRPRLNSSRDVSSLFSAGGLEGRTPSPSLSRSSSLSDTASSLSVPLRPPSLVTPQAYAFSFSQRHRKSANFSGPSLSAIMSSSDASNFLAGLRGSIKRPQKQHATRPANLDADLAASAQTVGDDDDDEDESGSSLQDDDEEDEDEDDEDADEMTPLKRPLGARRNQQTLGSMARRRRQFGDADDSGDDGLWSCFPCFVCQVRIWPLFSSSQLAVFTPHTSNVWETTVVGGDIPK